MSQPQGNTQATSGGYQPVPTESYDNIQPGKNAAVYSSEGNGGSAGQPVSVGSPPQYQHSGQPQGQAGAMASGPPMAGYPSPGQPVAVYQPQGYPGGGGPPMVGYQYQGQPIPQYQPQGNPGAMAMGTGPPMGGYQTPGQPVPVYPPQQYPGGAMVVHNGGPNQPDQWVSAIPGGIPNCPPGLEYLVAIDKLLVHQKLEMMEVISGVESENKYTIKNGIGQNVYSAIEINDWCTMNMCGSRRPFDLKIYDAYNKEVLHLKRPLRCQYCCFPGLLQTMDVKSPDGSLLGRIEQNWSFISPRFSLKNANNETFLKIEGPWWRYGGDVNFQIFGLDGKQVGKLTKQWTTTHQELYTDADNFGITFPLELDVKMKAVCLGTCFLIDMMFFEN